MPNAILRAGPFATSSDSFVDEPLVANSSTLPVNCANDTSSSTWPWKYSLSSSFSKNVHTGWEETSPDDYDAILSSSFDSNSSYQNATNNFSVARTESTNFSALVSIGFRFYYQAVENFNITINYSGSISSGTSGTSSGIAVSDIYGVIANTSSDSASGSHTATLPKSVVPSLYVVVITSNAFKYPLPDPTDVNPVNKVVSATLGISF